MVFCAFMAFYFFYLSATSCKKDPEKAKRALMMVNVWLAATIVIMVLKP